MPRHDLPTEHRLATTLSGAVGLVMVGELDRLAEAAGDRQSHQAQSGHRLDGWFRDRRHIHDPARVTETRGVARHVVEAGQAKAAGREQVLKHEVSRAI